MKVLIVNNMEPFIWGGAEELALNLKKNLIKFGFESEILRIPFRYEPEIEIPQQMLLAANLQLLNVDRVIALKFPAYLIPHHQKVFWLLHQFRQVYDLREEGRGNSSDEVAELIRAADSDAISRAHNVFCNSHVTRDRLKRYNGLDAQILLPPVNDPELFFPESEEGYIFAGGRVNAYKRQALLIEAMKFADRKVRLVIAGPPDREGTQFELEKLADVHGVADRVRFDLKFHSRQEIAALVNSSVACAYLPKDEDSLGYVAMEAAEAGKALITTSDSGGVADMVVKGTSGWCVAPTPQQLGKAMSQAFGNLRRTREMGMQAREIWHARGINWESTVGSLTS